MLPCGWIIALSVYFGLYFDLVTFSAYFQISKQKSYLIVPTTKP